MVSPELRKQPPRESVRPHERAAYDRVVARQTSYGYTKPDAGYDVRPAGEEAGPYFGVLLRAPIPADYLSELGAYYRSRGEVPGSYQHKDREWVDVVLGNHLGVNMWGHIMDAMAVGVRPDAILAVLEHRDADLEEDEFRKAQYIRRFADGALEESDWEWLRDTMGERAAIEYAMLIAHLITTIRLIQAFQTRKMDSDEDCARRVREVVETNAPLPDPKARIPQPDPADLVAA